MKIEEAVEKARRHAVSESNAVFPAISSADIRSTLLTMEAIGLVKFDRPKPETTAQKFRKYLKNEADMDSLGAEAFILGLEKEGFHVSQAVCTEQSGVSRAPWIDKT